MFYDDWSKEKGSRPLVFIRIWVALDIQLQELLLKPTGNVTFIKVADVIQG